MNIYDENSYPQEQLEGNANVGGRRKKGKRRSSILKMTKSPTRGLVLDDIDPNAQNSEDTTDKFKNSRSCSSRRVSFAETCQIKEIPNEVTKRTWEWQEEEEGQFENDKNAPGQDARVPVPEVANTCGNSSYRQPASTLAGLSSLLSSPIQDSPEKARYRQTNEGPCVMTSLDFTLIGHGADVSINEMDMTSNNTARILIGENAARIQPAQTYSYQTEMQQAQQWQARQENTIAEKTTSLDFTRCFGGQDEGDLTSDQMEFTIDHGNEMMVGENSGYILSNTSVRKSTSAPREVLREISDDVPTMVNEGYNSWRGTSEEGNDEMRPGALRSAALSSCNDDMSETKVDGLAFLRHLGSVKVHEASSNQGYHPRQTANDVQRSSVTIPVMSSHDESNDKIDGAAFCRSLGIGKTQREDTDCSAQLDLTVARGRILDLRENDRFHQGEMEHGSQAFDQTLVADNQDMEMTRCLSNVGAQERDGSKVDPKIYRDEDYEDMEMTRCLSKVGAQGNDGTKVDPKIHRDEVYEDMEMTRCVSKVEAQGMNGSKIDPKIHRDEDYEDMEMTRCVSKVGAQGNEETKVDPKIYRDEDYEDMEMTRCVSKVGAQGNEETKVEPKIYRDEDYEDMEMTRCVSKVGAQGINGSKIDTKFHIDGDYEDMETTRCVSKVGAQGINGSKIDSKIHRDEDYEDMEITRCMSKVEVQGRNECHVASLIATGVDHQEMEMTRCLPDTGRNERKVDLQIHRDKEDMAITRCLPKVWALEKNEGKVGQQIHRDDDCQDMDMTACLPTGERQERDINKSNAEPQNVEESHDMEMTGRQPVPKVNSVEDNERQVMDMTACLPTSERKERNINKSKAGPEIIEQSYHMEMTCRQPVPKVNNVEDNERQVMHMTACLPTSERKERNINKSEAGPEIIEQSYRMEMTCRQPVPKVNSVEDNERQVMHMTACLPTSERKERNINKSKVGPEIIEQNYHMEMACRQLVPKVNIVEDKKDQEMDTIRCLQGNNESKFGLQVVKDENGEVMDMTACLPTGERQERNINESKAGPQNVEENHGLPMICRQPVQAMSETAPEFFNKTLPSECDAADTTQCGSEAKLIRGDTRLQVIGKTFNNDGHCTETPKDIHVDASSKGTSLDAEGCASSKLYTSVATSTEEPCRLQEWNIDLSHFSKEPAQFAARDSAAENPETRNVITPVAVRDLNSKDPSNSWLKQANVKRKVALSLSANEGMKIKRKVVDGGDLKNLTVSSDDAVDDVPRLSQTLPAVKSSTAKVVPKKEAQINVTANFAGSGTHKVVHVGGSIFAAKGPTIGLKHYMLYRKHLPSARLAHASGDGGGGIKPDPCSMLVTHVPEKSRECEVLAGSSAGGLGSHGDCSQVKSPRKECGTVSGVPDGSSSESVCSAPPPMPLANKFLSRSVDGESFILDESIPREVLDMKDETTEKGMFKDAEQNKSPENLEKKGHAATPNLFDVVLSEIKSTMKKDLSVITEESACDHKTKDDDDHKTLSDDVGMLSCEYPSNPEEPYTLNEFLALCNISFFKHVTRRSEIPIAAPELSMEMKDKIYRQCLSEAKSSLWDNFAKDLQAVITENNELRIAKEQELNQSNPTVFSELKRSLALYPKNSDVVHKIKALKRACRHSATKYWYDRRKVMDEAVLALLKEQEQILSDDLSRLDIQKKNLDGDFSLVDQLTLDLDNKIEDLEVTLESEEKSWNECKKEIEDSKKQLDDLELELQNQEKQREQLASENDGMSRQITDTKIKKAELESVIESLEEMACPTSCLEATKAEEKFFKSALEWELDKHEATSLEFRYVYRTFKLDISFEDSQDSSAAAKIKHVNLISRLADDCSPVAKLCHQLIVEKFSQCDFVQMFPSRENLPQLLHLVSVPMSKVRLFLEEVDVISINHLVYLNEKQFTIAFSSYKKFIKFLITFDLSNFVNDGILPRTVVKKIGKTSSDDIVKQLSDIPSTVLSLQKLLKAADKFLN